MDEADVLRLSAIEQARLVRTGELSARELVEASLRRIERLNPQVNAFVAVCAERALAEADAVQPGDQRPLCGIPVGIKDLLSATTGLPTSEGSAAFGDWVADHDSAHVRRLRQSGAIVVGKTNTPELGLRPVTENLRFGATRNPWDPRLSAGGSSGGSAAAVACGMVALADGSDLGGSIRIPASCCGVVGLKPSLGRVSMSPDFGDLAAGMAADGVLTRTVMDTAVALDAIAGYEPGDRRHAPVLRTSFAEAARMQLGRLPVRLCLTAPHGVDVDDGPATAATIAAEALAALGHDVRDA
ncbi:MAG: amidase, partial [Gaiellaceae bacterium]|nr:amidase [Gaiellaceae bacterium]